MQLPAGAPVAAARHVEDSKRGLLRALSIGGVGLWD